MRIERHPWVRVANYAAGWEADLAAARVDAEEIPVRVSGNDLTGIFGPGFQGVTARGFFVEVPAPFVERARYVLSRAMTDPEAEGGAPGEDD